MPTPQVFICISRHSQSLLIPKTARLPGPWLRRCWRLWQPSNWNSQKKALMFFLGKVFYNIPYVSLLLGSPIKKKNAMLNFLTLRSLGQYGVSWFDLKIYSLQQQPLTDLCSCSAKAVWSGLSIQHMKLLITWVRWNTRQLHAKANEATRQSEFHTTWAILKWRLKG